MKIKLPDIGDFTNVDVIEILVEVGHHVVKNQPTQLELKPLVLHLICVMR